MPSYVTNIIFAILWYLKSFDDTSCYLMNQVMISYAILNHLIQSYAILCHLICPWEVHLGGFSGLRCCVTARCSCGVLGASLWALLGRSWGAFGGLLGGLGALLSFRF